MPMSPRTLRPRSGVFSPRQISGLALWLDAADSSTLFQDTAATIPATATNDPVGAWLDKSGNGRHATQGTGASRPTVAASSLNSRGTVAFAGTSSQRLGATVPGTDGQLYTVLAVVRNATSANGVLMGERGGNFTNALHFQGANNRLTMYLQRGEPLYGPHGGAAVIYAASKDSASLFRGYQNGARVVNDDGATPSGLNLANLLRNIGSSTAGASSFTGNIAELIAYPSSLSDANRQRIERYLASKWGITLAPQVANADAQDWINRVYANGGTVSAATASAVNTFCDAIDAAGLRDRFYRLNLFAGNSDASLNAVRTPLYRGPSLGGTQYGNTTDTNVNFVAGDYAETGASGGLTGNGTNKSLQTGIRPDQMPTGFESNVHLAAYRRTAGNGQALLGSYYYNTSTTTDRHNYELAIEGGVLGREVGAQVPAGSSYPRFTVSTRSSSSSMFTYANGTAGVENTGATAGVATGVPFTVFGRNLITGTPPASGTYSATFNTSSALGGYSIGASMSPAQVSAYTAAMQAFQAALSRNV